MKLKMTVVLPLIAVAIVAVGVACRKTDDQEAVPANNQKVLYYTCPMHPSVKSDKPGNCSLCGMELQPVYGHGAATNDATAGGNPKPYPLDVCLVDGMKLGSMGDPYVFVYQGQQIKFCCAGCKPEFLKDPAQYLKKIQDSITNLPNK